MPVTKQGWVGSWHDGCSQQLSGFANWPRVAAHYLCLSDTAMMRIRPVGMTHMLYTRNCRAAARSNLYVSLVQI